MLTDASRRESFPSLADRAYLNTAAEGIPSVAVVEAVATYMQDKLLGMDGRVLHESQWDEARKQAAVAYGLPAADDVGLCSCSSEAYNLVAMALCLREGDQVVINDLDFPSGATAWLQPSCPATVKVWRARQGALRVEDLVPLLTPRTRFVTTSLVSFFNGFMVPLPAVIDAVRRHSDALLAVDVTQALGRVPLALDGVDLIISSTHKWIMATHGGGIVGVPPARRDEWTVPAGGWFNLANAFQADRFETARSKAGAASFAVGMPNYAAVYAINAALQYIADIGVDRIAAAADPLVRACLDGIKQLPVELITPDEPDALAGILAFRHPKGESLNHALREHDIHIMSQAGRLRVAIHGYNTMDDVERLLATLKKVLDHV